MATQPTLCPASGYSCRHGSEDSNAWRSYFFLMAFLFLASTAHAQLQQPFVYTTGGGIATRNDQNGALTPTAESPLSVLGFPAVIDAKGRFLFAAGNDSIHMYRVDAATGSYTEVSGSPFASANTNGPILIATEPTGTYLAVVNSTGLNPGESSAESFQIDSGGEALIPVSGSFLELVSSPIGAASNPALGTFFVYLGPNPDSSNSNYQQDGDLLTYTIDPATGLLGSETGANGSADHGRSFGADPLGRFVVTGGGQLSGILQVTSAAGAQGTFNAGSGISPEEIFVAPGGRFVYVTLFHGPNRVVHIYIVDTVHWTLTESPSSPLPGFTSVAGLVADPSGQFVYESTAPNQVRVYSVDLASGYLTEIADSPFAAPGFGLPIAFSVNAGAIQPEVGAVATFTPPTGLAFDSTPLGTPSVAQTMVLSSTGNQPLIVNGIAVTGLNAGEFSEADNCGVPTVMPPTNSCSISIVFAPAASGRHQALLTVTDNAPGSPQSALLVGTGAGSPQPAPAITFSPGSLNFSPLAQGSTSTPLSITVTNSGNAALNISTIVVGGNNPGDFSATSINPNCVGTPIAPNGSCTVTVTFTPSAVGTRQATLNFIDNAAGSPQSVTLRGGGIIQPISGPAITFSSTVLNFPVTLQGTSGAVMEVSIKNSGNAPLHISSMSVGGNGSTEFTNSLTTCAPATVAVNATCTAFGVIFSPISSGPHAETISVTDDAPNSPQVINVSGTGAPIFIVSTPLSALSATVTAGQTASYNLQLTAAANFTGTVSFMCGGAPIGATCKVPPTVNLVGGTSSPLAVTVTTSGRALIVPSLRTRRAPLAIFALAFAVLFYGLALTPWRIGARRPHITVSDRWQRRVVHAAIVLLMWMPTMLVLQGCGGGGVTSAPVPLGNHVVTPSGTAILVLTPSANSLSGKPLQLSPIQLTLNVN